MATELVVASKQCNEESVSNNWGFPWAFLCIMGDNISISAIIDGAGALWQRPLWRDLGKKQLSLLGAGIFILFFLIQSLMVELHSCGQHSIISVSVKIIC